MNPLPILRHLIVVLLFCMAAPSGAARESVNVAYFSEWATPSLLAKSAQRFDQRMGVAVNWVPFKNGNAMTAAMVAGDIDIAYSLGLTSFATAVNADAPITIVGIAVAYPAVDDCFVQTDGDLDRHNAAELAGKSVAVALNTLSEFRFRMTLDALGVDVTALTLLDQDPADAAESLANGDVALACGFGEGPLARMHSVGTPLLSRTEKADGGINQFDVVSASNRFLVTEPGLLNAFLDVVHEANAAFESDTQSLDIIASEAGFSVDQAKAQLSQFRFPSPAAQRRDYIAPDGLAERMLAFTGRVFATEQYPEQRDYGLFIDLSFLD